MSKKNIAVIGLLVKDRIVTIDNKQTEALGGIAYTLTALASSSDKLNVIPVCPAGNDIENQISGAFGKHKNIDLRGVRHIDAPNKIHQLIYRPSGSRQEQNIGKMPGIRPSDFDSIDRLDAAVVNYIGGDEFPPRHIDWLLKRYRPLLYMDYHSLSLGKRQLNGKPDEVERYLRYNPKWKEYISFAEIVQMNFWEFKSIFADVENENSSIEQHIYKLLKLGPKIAVITREEKGVAMAYGDNMSKVLLFLPAYPVAKLVDPTGCGDSFGAGFLSSYLENNDIMQACTNGLKLAAAKAGFSGLDGFLKK